MSIKSLACVLKNNMYYVIRYTDGSYYSHTPWWGYASYLSAATKYTSLDDARRDASRIGIVVAITYKWNEDGSPIGWVELTPEEVFAFEHNSKLGDNVFL